MLFQVMLIIKSAFQEGLETCQPYCGLPIFATVTRIPCATRVHCYEFLYPVVAVDRLAHPRQLAAIARPVSPIW